MNKTIKALNKKLNEVNSDASEIETQLQAAWNEVFKDSGVIKAMVTNLENSTEYSTNEYGEIVSYFYADVSDFEDCKQYFDVYMREYHFIEVDEDRLELSQGSDNLIIQFDTRHDNGVWCESKLVIKESEYKNDDGEVDTAKRNELIEKYMEKTGCFPGVFRIDYHGNVFPVNTKEGE